MIRYIYFVLILLLSYQDQGRAQRPVLVADVRAGNPNLNLQKVTALSNRGALVRSQAHGRYAVREVDSNGTVHGNAIYSSRGKIAAMLPREDDLLIVQKNNYIRRIKDNNLLNTYNYGGFRVYGAILLERNTILYTECPHRSEGTGKVKTYNISSGATEIKRHLSCPYGIARFTNSTSTLYFVGEMWTTSIRVFDESWNDVTSIGSTGSGDGHMYYPWGITLTSTPTILVADFWNKRVSEFTFEGRWLRHILTERNGIKNPMQLSINPNQPQYLWIAYYKYPNYNVKCYQIY